MKIETKETVILTDDEKRLIIKTMPLMLDILESVNDVTIYNTTKQILDGMEKFISLVDTEVE